METSVTSGPVVKMSVGWNLIKIQGTERENQKFRFHFNDEQRVVEISIDWGNEQGKLFLDYAKWNDVANEPELTDDRLNIISLDHCSQNLGTHLCRLLDDFPYRKENNSLKSFIEILDLVLQACKGLYNHKSIDPLLQDRVIQNVNKALPVEANDGNFSLRSVLDCARESPQHSHIAEEIEEILKKLEKKVEDNNYIADQLRGVLKSFDAFKDIEVDQARDSVKLFLGLSAGHLSGPWVAMEGSLTLEISNAHVSKYDCPSISIFAPSGLALQDLLVPELNRIMNRLLGFVPIPPSPTTRWAEQVLQLLLRFLDGKVCLCGGVEPASSLLPWLSSPCLQFSECSLQLKRLSKRVRGSTLHATARDFEPGAALLRPNEPAALAAGNLPLLLAAEAAASERADFTLGPVLPPGFWSWEEVRTSLHRLDGLASVMRDWCGWTGVDGKGVRVGLNLAAAQEEVRKLDGNGLAAWALGMAAGGPPRLLPLPAAAQLTQLRTGLQYARSGGVDAEWRSLVEGAGGEWFAAWHGAPLDCWPGIVERGLECCSDIARLRRHGKGLGAGVYLGQQLGVSWPYAMAWKGEDWPWAGTKRRGGGGDLGRARQRARSGLTWVTGERDEVEEEEGVVGRWEPAGELRIVGVVEVAGRREDYQRGTDAFVVKDARLIRLRAVVVWEGKEAVAAPPKVSAEALDAKVREWFPL